MPAANRISLLFLGFVATSTALAADTVNVTFNSATYPSNWVTYTYDDATHGGLATELNFTVDGETVLGYCIDLDHDLSFGVNYEAELVPLPIEEPWCQVANILDTYEVTDAWSSGVLQSALWMTIYPGEVSVSPFGTDAQAVIDSTPDTCFAGCTDLIDLETDLAVGSDGLVTVDLLVSRAGEAIPGQEVMVATSLGSLLDPADGVAWADDDGHVMVTVDPEGAPDGLLVTFTAAGRDYQSIVPTTALQQVAGIVGSECDWEQVEDAYDSGDYWTARYLCATANK